MEKRQRFRLVWQAMKDEMEEERIPTKYVDNCPAWKTPDGDARQLQHSYLLELRALRKGGSSMQY
ncbi:hypothetical protein ACRALDRAFT_211542 [Sodiomyces alcalophilus JCM 7366]|uniref:uncharacterized protein n=1 Tax=Sodiomyces alcalophilus JCM 7366 TaxID=591952 RepID=UPI0039B5F614